MAGRRIVALVINIRRKRCRVLGCARRSRQEGHHLYRQSEGNVGCPGVSTQGPPGDDKLGRDQVEKRLSELLGMGLPPGGKGPVEKHYDVLRGLVEELRNDPGVDQVYTTGYPISPVRYPHG